MNYKFKEGDVVRYIRQTKHCEHWFDKKFKICMPGHIMSKSICLEDVSEYFKQGSLVTLDHTFLELVESKNKKTQLELFQ